MDAVNTNKSFVQPKTMAELLPGLSSILSKDSIHTLTAKKQPRPTMAIPHTAERNVKPLTIAEMRADILALKVQSPRKFAQPTTSTRKKIWNTSVKLESKTKSHTAEGQLRHNSVRKVLNFQPKPKTTSIPKTVVNSKAPTFTRPEFRAKKSLHPSVKDPVRISGICKMPETPVINNKFNKPRMTLANKENFASAPNIDIKSQVTPVINKKSIAPHVPSTPLANMSWISNSDTSFLQKEKEAQDIEDKQALSEKPISEKPELSPPVSTPFKEYRSVQDFFDHSNDVDNSAVCHDDTITSFDKVTICKENSKREESVIVSLCDLLCKASVINTDQTSTELNDLLEVEKQIEHNMTMIENGIKILVNMKESHLKSLKCVKKLINEKRISRNDNNNVLSKEKSVHVNEINTNTSLVINKQTSVIKLKSPSYKIPKKNACLKKKIFHKSMPNVSEMKTPNKDMDERALHMYMKMKEQMNFLNTPLVKYRKQEIPDTPTVTSHNLQMQLDKLYKDNT